MFIVLSGTRRPGSNTRRVSELVARDLRAAGAEASILDLKDLPADAFAPEAYGERPASMAPFVDAFLASEGVVVVTPEYNGSFPGVLKHFLDLLPFPEALEARPVAFVGLAAGQWGALRSVEQLQQVFGYRNAHAYPVRVFLPQIHRLLDESGAFRDPALAERLAAQAAGFVRFARRVRG